MVAPPRVLWIASCHDPLLVTLDCRIADLQRHFPHELLPPSLDQVHYGCQLALPVCVGVAFHTDSNQPTMRVQPQISIAADMGRAIQRRLDRIKGKLVPKELKFYNCPPARENNWSVD